MKAMKIKNLDHLVITTRNLDSCLHFYVDVLGMECDRGNGRYSVRFGNQKFNIHTKKAEFLPAAAYPTSDVRFLAAGFQENINNEYMDTMQFARKLYPDLPHHRLSDLSEYLNLTNNEHRAIADCVTTIELYEAMKTEMAQKGLGIRDLWQVNSSGRSGIDIGAITATTDDIDEDGFFYGMWCSLENLNK